MGCLPKQLTNEIRKKMELVRRPKNKHRYDLGCQKRKIKAIKKNAQIESYRIEHPKRPVPYNIPKNNREIKQGIKNIQNAFNWGERNFDPEEFNESFIRNLAFRITPELYEEKKNADYRDMSVRITGSKFTPPYPWKVKNLEIPEFIKNLKRYFESNNLIVNLKTGFYAHFNLARIHPFEDGNGRTARALQDIILDYYGFPLPVIEAGERMTYYEFLENAVEGYKDRKSEDIKKLSEGEKSFYLYMAGKVNASLDKIICNNNFH